MMKKKLHHIFFKSTHGFTMIEVMAAMLILALVCVAYSENQVGAIQLVKTTRYRDMAIMLATQKMEELDFEISQKGIESLKDSDKGEFDQEKYLNFSWAMTKKNIPAPDFAALMAQAGGSEEDEESTPQQGFAGPMKAITEIWGKSIIQLNLEVIWKEGEELKSYSLMTHYIASNANQQIQGLIGSMTGGAAAASGGATSGGGESTGGGQSKGGTTK